MLQVVSLQENLVRTDNVMAPVLATINGTLIQHTSSSLTSFTFIMCQPSLVSMNESKKWVNKIVVSFNVIIVTGKTCCKLHLLVECLKGPIVLTLHPL